MNVLQKTSELVNIWEPMKKYRLEPKYSDDLVSFLREKMPSILITRDDKNSKKGLDVGIKSESMYGVETIGIELKVNLHSTADLQRLVGQIETKGKQYHSIIIVLLGESSYNMAAELKRWIKNKNSVLGYSEKPILLKIKGNLV